MASNGGLLDEAGEAHLAPSIAATFATVSFGAWKPDRGYGVGRLASFESRDAGVLIFEVDGGGYLEAVFDEDRFCREEPSLWRLRSSPTPTSRRCPPPRTHGAIVSCEPSGRRAICSTNLQGGGRGTPDGDEAPMTESREGQAARVEIDLSGCLTEVDPVARAWFPRIERAGLEHPLFDRLPEHLRTLDLDRVDHIEWLQAHEDRTYRLTLSWDPDDGRLSMSFERVDGEWD